MTGSTSKGGHLSKLALCWTAVVLVLPMLPSVQASVTVMDARLPTGLYGTSAVWSDGAAYIFGGRSDADYYQTTFHSETLRFDPSSGAVEVVGYLPTSRSGAAAVWDGESAYIFGGRNESGFFDEILRYSPPIRSYQRMEAKLPMRMEGIGAVWADQYAYIFGGFTGGITSNQIARYDPETDTLQAMNATLPFDNVHYPSAIWDGNNAYIFCNGEHSLRVVRYTPATDTVTVMKATLPDGYSWTSAIWDGDAAYIFGGSDAYSGSTEMPGVSRIARYDVAKDKLTVVDELPTWRLMTSAVWDGQDAYIFGGFGQGNQSGTPYLDQVVRFNPPAATPLFEVPRVWIAAIGILAGTGIAAAAIVWVRRGRKRRPAHVMPTRRPATSSVLAKQDTLGFDVFLCYNSKDKAAVKALAKRLQAAGIRPWLDEWELPPGQPWQPLLERQMASIRSAAVCIGATGIGPWQNLEIQTFLWEFVRRGCPVIPVLLPDAPGQPSLPMFLRNMTWVDLRRQDIDPFQQLLWGIKGIRPAAA